MIMAMRKEKSDELKPCPCCGCKAGLYQAYNGFWQVQCNVCNIGTLKTTDKEHAISIWNRRVCENERDVKKSPKCVDDNLTNSVHFYCAECDEEIAKFDDYCYVCGQAIDWSDFDEE